MATNSSIGRIEAPAGWPARVGEACHALSWTILLASGVGRAMIAELPFRVTPLKVQELLAQLATQSDMPVLLNHSNLTRAIFASLLMLAGVIWLLGGVFAGRLRVPSAWLWVGWAVWAIWAVVSAGAAEDQPTAWLTTMEQIALLAGGLTAASLAGEPRRRGQLVVVLAALGATLAGKALFQLVYEIPQRIAFFREDPVRQLLAMGVEPGTAKAAMLEKRLTNTTASGYLGLANLFGSQMLVLLGAGGGLAVAKIIYAVRHRRLHGRADKGEVPTPVVAAGLVVAGIVAMVVALVATRSRGAIGAGGLVVLAVAAGWRWQGWLARRWRVVAGSTLGGLALLVVAVALYGLWRGSLPTKTLAFRWHYWTGSARLVERAPLRGVGAGNFPRSYLRVRRPEGEEEVKTPHNVIMHALVQFGLVGGGLYLAVLAGALIRAWRPEPTPPPDESVGRAPPRWRDDALLFAVVLIAAGLCRWWWSRGVRGIDPNLLVLDVLVPSIVLGVALLAMRWFAAGDSLPGRGVTAMRVGLAAGGAAMVIHNLVSYSLWTGATATLFWLAVGGAIASGDDRIIARRWLVGLWTLVGAAVAGWLVLLVLPAAWAKEDFARQIALRLIRHDRAGAIGLADRWASLDSRDPLTAMEAARLNYRQPRRAEIFAAQAVGRAPGYSEAWRLYSQVLSRLEDWPAAADAMGEAVANDPASLSLRLELAERLIRAGDPAGAAVQLDKVERMNEALRAFNPESLKQLNVAQRAEVAALRRTIRAATQTPPAGR